LKTAIEISMNDYVDDIRKIIPKEPEECSEAVEICFLQNRNKGPTVFNRKFNLNDKIGDIKNYIKMLFRTYGDVKLSGSVSNKIYINNNDSLRDSGFAEKETLIVEIIE